ncbi:Sterile alpha and TIR motif-containing protein [Echinococcus granulosus]|uniref:ADP-ribosyl cyclase/cyclic ADP-ribose hydrolase n=1 Tax=Echinococcus granulosus TaxID=6210 RepID=W6UDR0_ECHGR|nr:Sterile alpha and TIR motif-containing protein [Echinococcus granulosus]EUB59183.1 Sterile alpha and TIR motif-containing protein [Echinococcus granulosus]
MSKFIITRGITYRLADSPLYTSTLETYEVTSPTLSSPMMENTRLQHLHSSSLSAAASATSKSTSIKTSKTVATSSMTVEGMKTLSVRSASASTTKSSFLESSSTSRMIEDSSKLVANITEMRNLFQQSNVSESVLEQIEHHCQARDALETFLPPSSRQVEPLFTQRKGSSAHLTTNEIGFRFKQVKKRTNLTCLRLLRQLVNEVGLDAALSGSVGVPILEAFCSCSIPDSSPPLSSTAGTGLTETTMVFKNELPPGEKMRQAVRLLMAKGRDATMDRELNSEFVALIEELTNYNENTCQDVIEEGGLDCVFRACRSEDTEAVKHALLSMVNLLHRVGRDHQYEMVRQNTFAWLLLLALQSNEEIQYYVFLIVTILSNNRTGALRTSDVILAMTTKNGEMKRTPVLLCGVVVVSAPHCRPSASTVASPGATFNQPLNRMELDGVLDRSLLMSLMIPFVKRHDVRDFARRHFTDQTTIFSGDWLLFLLPALTSETYVEVEAFAAFHFAIAAHLKPDILLELGPGSARVESALVKISGLKRDPAWKLAALALDSMGSKVPKALSLQVFHWPVEDVVCWMNREGFEAVAEKCKTLKIDGDILLSLTEKELEEGLGITNCIARRRFMRQLCHLKSMVNYSLIDPTGVADFLAEASKDVRDSNSRTAETVSVDKDRLSRSTSSTTTALAIASTIPTALLTQYTYTLLCHGVTRQRLLEVTDEELKNTFHISDATHRRQLLKAVKKDASGGSAAHDASENHIDFFISYRRSNGTHLASLIKTLLQLRNYRVFLDIERLKGGRFENKLMDSIKHSENFILVLTEGALDRCSTDGSIDWEINCALENNCHIIPLSDRFDWGNADTLPEDICAITKFNSVQWTPELEEGCIDRIIEFMRQNSQSEEGKK